MRPRDRLVERGSDVCRHRSSDTGAYLVDVETFETLRQRVALLEGIARG
jgi:hypothetical protein